ncbi:synemin isoform X2 [Rhinolophus sinicus]|uniref:synemin isoform X2 n=1 Tax=Rhinolophus sinicus TaxID=89399 RepID=UPI003D7AE339
MLSWRLHTSSEKAELQELNARLSEYVCRVRELERENLLLEEELRGRRRKEGLGAQGQARWAEEARGLRQQLDELSWATALAEGERDALRQELRELQLLGEEERAARARLDAELGVQRRELQEALGARAALEALLGRLQAERRGLDATHEREVRELRARAASLTLHYRARTTGPAAPPPRLREVHDSYALLVAESWRDSVQLYEDEVRELEAALRHGQESRLQAEEETRLCAQEAEALQRQALELEQLRVLLEDELLRKREAYELQAEERQNVLACLEEEKAALTLAMADRLRDYQELLQVKTGLSLEVATYRALLEGESNPEILILTERIENLPQEFRNTSYHYTNSVLQRENERNRFLRQKPPSGRFQHSSALPSNLWADRASHTRNVARRSFLGSGYPSFTTTRREHAYEKTTSSSPANFRTFSPSHGLLRNTEAQLKTFPSGPRTEGTRDAPARVTKESSFTQESYRERQGNVVASASESPWSNERTVILGKKTEAKATREQERNRAGTVQAKREEKMFDSKEKASEERNLRWEELTKLDKEARKRESQQMREKVEEKLPSKEKSVREREVPIRLDLSQDSTPEGAPKGFQTPLKKDAGGGPAKRVERREARLRWDARDATGSLKGDSMTEAIAEDIVSGILKQLSPSPTTEAPADSFPDTRVTYVGRKELPGDKKTKTEIVVESKLTEVVDVSEEAGQDYLLSMNVREKVGLKGKSTEQAIGDIISLGLKGRQGTAKVVNVEIIEEPLSYVGGEKAGEFSTPFHVQEVDDMSPGSQGLAEEAGYGEREVMFSVHQRKETELPQENVSHVEEVTEAGDSEGEQSYFVSTPDECPEHDIGHDRDEGSVYGQVHIEEESTIRYSWQDEIVPGSRRRIRVGDALGEKVVKPLDVPEPSLEGDVGSPHWKEQSRSGEFHAEATVIEKEIKIPHEFHTSVRRDSKEPRHQMVEVIGQLEDSLPERLKEELSALTKEGQSGSGNVSVDVKKIPTSGDGSMTLVAEVNLSETVDADQLDLELLSKGEAGEIEKAVESVVRDAVARRYSPAPGSPDREASGPAPVAGFGFKRWATQELYRPCAEDDDAAWASHSTHRVTSQGPVSATVEVTSPTGFAQSHVLEDVSQSVRHIKIDTPGIWRTERVTREGPIAEVVEMDVSNVEVAPTWTGEATFLFPTGTEAEARSVSDSGTWRDPGGRNDRAASVSFQGKEQAEFDKTVQLQRMVDQRSVVSDEKKVAVLYLDNQEEDEGHWF